MAPALPGETATASGADASGEPGELQIAGASVTPGYWHQPEATAQAIEGGWLHTGDVAVCRPGGQIRIVDRTKDMYISGGENVYPAEVEEVLYHHPAVAEAAVVGVPDERWGETGAAWIVLAAGAAAEPDELRSWLRARLAAFKVPRDIHVVAELRATHRQGHQGRTAPPGRAGLVVRGGITQAIRRADGPLGDRLGAERVMNGTDPGWGRAWPPRKPDDLLGYDRGGRACAPLR